MCLGLLQPNLKLTDRERDVVAAILKVYYGNRNTDPKIVGKAIFSRKVKKSIAKSTNMSSDQLNFIVMNLRKKKILTGTDLNPALLRTFPDKSRNTQIFFNVMVVIPENVL